MLTKSQRVDIDLLGGYVFRRRVLVERCRCEEPNKFRRKILFLFFPFFFLLGLTLQIAIRDRVSTGTSTMVS